MKNILVLLRLMRDFRGKVALSILFGFATIASGIGLMATSAWLISRAALQPSIAVLQVSIVGVRFFGISRGVFRYLERLVSHDVNLRLLSRLRRRVYDTLERIWPAAALHYESGDLLSRATADIDLLENFYVRVVSPVVIAVLITASVAIFTGTYDTRLAWVLTAGMLMNGLLVPVAGRLTSRRPRAQLPVLRGQLSSAVSQNIQGQRDLLVYSMQTRQMGQFELFQTQFAQEQIRLARREGLAEALNTVIPNLTTFGVLVTAIPLVTGGEMDGVLLAMLVLLALASFEAVNPLGLAAHNLDLSLQASSRLLNLETIEPPLQTPAVPRAVPSAPYTLQVENLSFSYPGSHQIALQDISFNLEPGNHVALVGPSGAGKTTLINLLLRLWDAPPDSVFINGTDVRRCPASEIRALFSTVSQRGWLFGRPLRQNLLIAQPNASDAQLMEALRLADLGDWLAGLPDGLNTWLGESLKISGGEKQRLMLARAFLQDRPIWLLDEPTVHLDPAAEQRVMDTLFHTLYGRSALWVMHSLTHMECMDEILVLHEGRIAERGTHADLLAHNGFYRRLFETSQRN